MGRKYLFLIIFLELIAGFISKKSFVICRTPFADTCRQKTLAFI